MVLRHQFLKIAALVALFLVPSVSVATDWKKQFSGLDIVALSCLDHSDGGYGKALCESYFSALETELVAAKVPVIRLGTFRPDGTEPLLPNEFDRALNVRLFVRGTAGNQIAVQLRSRASVTYLAAVEQGQTEDARSGELVLWENSVTGSGPSKPLREAISQAIVSRSETLLQNLRDHWSNP